MGLRPSQASDTQQSNAMQSVQLNSLLPPMHSVICYWMQGHCNTIPSLSSFKVPFRNALSSSGLPIRLFLKRKTYQKSISSTFYFSFEHAIFTSKPNTVIQCTCQLNNIESSLPSSLYSESSSDQGSVHFSLALTSSIINGNKSALD